MRSRKKRNRLHAFFEKRKEKREEKNSVPHLRRFPAASACPRCHPAAAAAAAADSAAGSQAGARSQRPRQSLSLSALLSSSLRPSTIAPALDQTAALLSPFFAPSSGTQNKQQIEETTLRLLEGEKSLPRKVGSSKRREEKESEETAGFLVLLVL